MDDLEASVRSAIHDRLQLARQPDVPAWDDEAVAAIMAAACEHAAEAVRAAGDSGLRHPGPEPAVIPERPVRPAARRGAKPAS